MALFMDIHYRVPGVTPQAVVDAHKRDLECQAKHGVRFRASYFNTQEGRIYCLFEAPTPEAGAACHAEAHGNLADEITEVREQI